jgi:hypothetical protein
MRNASKNMKQVIKFDSNSPVISIEQIQNDCDLGMSALYGIIAQGHKYVLSASASDQLFTFAAGHNRWSSATSFATLLHECLEHPDVKVFIFDDLEAYAEWILKTEVVEDCLETIAWAKTLSTKPR